MTTQPHQHVSALLRGQTGYEGTTISSVDGVVKTAREHGVSALLYAKLEETNQRDGYLDALRHALKADAFQQAALEPVTTEALRLQISQFNHEGIEFLLLKGTPLAYSLYSQAHLRPRADVDIFIAQKDCLRVKKLLNGSGFNQVLSIGGAIATHQFSMSKEVVQGCNLTLDIHWKITNPHAFAHLLGFDELYRCRQSIPNLDDNVFAPCMVHMLLHTLIHRVAHFHDRDRLIWLYDIFLLTQSLDKRSQTRFVDLCNAKKINTISVDGLKAAYHAFRGGNLQRLIHAITPNVDPAKESDTAKFLRFGFNMVDRLRSDWQTLRWPQRIQLLWEHCFPSSNYMRCRYGAAPLPWLYLSRIGNGVKRLLGFA